jgi:hypothetical protein
MQIGERLVDLLVEALDSDVVVSALRCVNGGRQRESVGQLERGSRSHCGGSSCQIHVDLDRLDPQADEHRIDGASAGSSGGLERPDQDLCVIDRGDESPGSWFQGSPYPFDSLTMMGIIPVEEGDEDVRVEDD